MYTTWRKTGKIYSRCTTSTQFIKRKRAASKAAKEKAQSTCHHSGLVRGCNGQCPDFHAYCKWSTHWCALFHSGWESRPDGSVFNERDRKIDSDYRHHWSGRKWSGEMGTSLSRSTALCGREKPDKDAPDYEEAFQVFAKEAAHHYTTDRYLWKDIEKEIVEVLAKI